MSKVKNRDRKQKTTGHADHSVHGDKAMSSPEMQDAPTLLMPTTSAQPSARKKEKRYGHN
ncbi:hypothetical protein ACEZCY_03560 [Streptacidiphilus sp. N1-12]|uniref:Small hydrophilic protein n=2 Tax=Streptacidiphilus alkalitolerans TaxID=3342712 RepID=A0ABV6W8K4_9ACTN